MNDLSPENKQNTQDLLGALLSNPELLRNIGGLLGTAPKSAPPSPDTEGTETDATPLGSAVGIDGLQEALKDPALMAKLPQMIELLKPLLSQTENNGGQEKDTALPVSARPHDGRRRGREDCRDELLLALKPFLSPERCEAVDAIIRIARLGNVLKTLQ